ncbi:ABC transporter substrate-binding protein [Streptomyces sp. NPDC057718]|uniref:ABC transporter substrate-binding protein n=1 Tax=Streptomyces sp. NPDC057718 TaxID=3346225 RepID=UPI00369F0FAC
MSISAARPPLSRRSFLAGSGAVVAALGLSACGGSSTSDSSSGKTQKISGKLGTIDVPVPVRQVVSVGQYRDTDAAVALGIIPVLSPSLERFIPGGIAPWVKEALGDKQLKIIDVTELPYERIASVKPGLILATDRQNLKKEYDRLTQIAPTMSWEEGYNEDDWRTTTTRIGKALGRTKEADEQIRLTEAAIAKAKKENPDFQGATFTLGPVTAEGTVNTINSTKDASAEFLAQLGMKLAPAVTKLPSSGIPGRAIVSGERLSVLDADVVMLTYNTPDVQKQMEANSVFKGLPAVRRGSYIGLDLPTALAIGFPSALSVRWGIEQLVPKIRTALR